MATAGQGRQQRLAWIGGAMTLGMVLGAGVAPWLAPFDPLKAVADSFGNPFPPQAAFPLGTDELGRDVCSRLIYGARISLIVAVVATTMTVVIGVTIGVSAGYFGGWVDT